jgi:hypothetical protein
MHFLLSEQEWCATSISRVCLKCYTADYISLYNFEIRLLVVHIADEAEVDITMHISRQ